MSIAPTQRIEITRPLQPEDWSSDTENLLWGQITELQQKTVQTPYMIIQTPIETANAYTKKSGTNGSTKQNKKVNLLAKQFVQAMLKSSKSLRLDYLNPELQKQVETCLDGNLSNLKLKSQTKYKSLMIDYCQLLLTAVSYPIYIYSLEETITNQIVLNLTMLLHLLIRSFQRDSSSLIMSISKPICLFIGVASLLLLILIQDIIAQWILTLSFLIAKLPLDLTDLYRMFFKSVGLLDLPFLKGFSCDLLQKADAMLKTITLSTGTHIEPSSNLFLVVRGTLVINCQGQIPYTNRYFGEKSLFTNQVDRVPLICQDRVTLKELDRQTFVSLLKDQDLELFCQIKDQIIFGESPQQIFTCNHCNRLDHSIDKCPYLHYVRVPNIEFLLFTKSRAFRKQLIQTMLDKNKIVRSISEYQQNIFEIDQLPQTSRKQIQGFGEDPMQVVLLQNHQDMEVQLQDFQIKTSKVTETQPNHKLCDQSQNLFQFEETAKNFIIYQPMWNLQLVLSKIQRLNKHSKRAFVKNED